MFVFVVQAECSKGFKVAKNSKFDDVQTLCSNNIIAIADHESRLIDVIPDKSFSIIVQSSNKMKLVLSAKGAGKLEILTATRDSAIRRLHTKLFECKSKIETMGLTGADYFHNLDRITDTSNDIVPTVVSDADAIQFWGAAQCDIVQIMDIASSLVCRCLFMVLELMDVIFAA